MQEIKVSGSGGIILLGKQGENLARQIQFDISRWISTFGPGTVQLLHQRSGDEVPYPVAVEQDGTKAIWTVTNADTASAGTGSTELQYYVGDTLAKSETWMTKVLPALGDAGETPPDPYQSWVDQIVKAGADAIEAADRAEAALGDSTWIGFEMDEAGDMYAILTPASGVSFSLSDDGYLEVIVNGD